MNLSFIDTKGLEFLFVSSDKTDLNLANEILEEKHTDADCKDRLIDYLNATYTDWHFFMRDCMIQRTKVRRIF
jgi:ATP-dependent Lon protease